MLAAASARSERRLFPLSSLFLKTRHRLALRSSRRHASKRRAARATRLDGQTANIWEQVQWHCARSDATASTLLTASQQASQLLSRQQLQPRALPADPNDTEESIWTFLSEARLIGADAARGQFLEVHCLGAVRGACLTACRAAPRAFVAICRRRECLPGAPEAAAAMSAGTLTARLRRLWLAGGCRVQSGSSLLLRLRRSRARGALSVDSRLVSGHR